MSFKASKSFEDRERMANEVLAKFNGEKLPIILEPKEKKLPPLDKIKYLVPNDMTVGTLLYVISERLKDASKDDAHKGLFLHIGDMVLTASQTVKEVYEKFAEKDHLLYMTYSHENVFG